MVKTLLLLLALCSCVSAFRIIQGGMGIRISSWQLAREVALKGELGVVSATCIDSVVVRDLQMGDKSGDIRRALAAFPDQDMANRFKDKFFIENGKAADKPFRGLPMWTLEPSQDLQEACVIANFCEVWLAKHNNDGTPIDGQVGINRLTKVKFPTVASLYGAILADVDYVIMGAGIPIQVPGVLDNLSEGQDAEFPVDVAGAEDEAIMKFSPKEFWAKGGNPDVFNQLKLKRPGFFPIVSSVVLAQSMLKKANGKGPTKGIQGFVVELNQAGGHNAPPRGFRYDPVAKSHAMDLNERGEPIYGPKDDVDLEKFIKASKGLPVFMAGAYAHKEKLQDIIDMGCQGIQCGTVFALAKESGMENTMKADILKQMADKDLDVFTDPVASPTGYPFKVLMLEDTLSEPERYQERPRACTLGYLRQAYVDKESGKLGYRCPAEPVNDWLKKGGEIEATVGRKCLCNALMANAGMPQVKSYKDANGEKKSYTEEMLITIGDEVNLARQFMKQDEEGNWSYSAGDVVEFLRSGLDESNAIKDLKDAIQAEIDSAAVKKEAAAKKA